MDVICSTNFDINSADSKNAQTPLHVAAARGHLNAAQYLVSHGALLDAVAGFKWTPLHFAVAYGHEDVAKFLVKKGAKYGDNQVDSLRRSPDILAKEYKRNWWSDIIS